MRFAAAEERYHLGRFFHHEGQRRLLDQDIQEALNLPDAESVDGDEWTRIVQYKYSNQPLSAIGSLYSSGRFNIGEDVTDSQLRAFPALYIASDYDTAYNEYFGVFQAKKGAPTMAAHELALQEPGSFSSCRLSVELQRLFDVRRLANLKPYASVETKFGLPDHLRALEKAIGHKATPKSLSAKSIRKTLMSIDWRFLPANFGIPAAPQVFGRAVRQAGYEGIVFQSTKSAGTCIAVFPDRLQTGSRVELRDEIPDQGIRIQTTLTADNYGNLLRH